MKRYLVLITATACALTSKSAPRELRYFSPEPPAEAGKAARPAAEPRAQLRLARIVPSAHLRYAIVHRDSEVEVAPYETLRWTEPPDAYVRRSLTHALFEARPIEQAVGGSAPTLEVELVAFEEVVRGTYHAGRVELGYQLHDERRVLARGTVVAERESRGAEIEPVVAAIGTAMTTATGDLADRVTAVLCPPR